VFLKNRKIEKGGELKISLNSINRVILCREFWIGISIVMIGVLLYPLFLPNLHVPVYDNFDSNVVWNKILAESGKIFAPNGEIVPNMMNGLPRASYGSEFDIMLWLYYFFPPRVAYVINELLIHAIAFFGMYIFLSKYVVPKDRYYRYALIYAGTLYFALLPLWSGAGASIATLPLTTYVLLNIKNRVESRWEWLYLILLPLYSSLVIIYMFYIIYAGLYWLYDGWRDRSLNWRLFGAIFLMGLFFLLKEYRLVYSTFIDATFVSHRTDFDVFFNESLAETYRLVLVKVLQGHTPHAQGLQQLYIIPMATMATLLAFNRRRFNKVESMVIWFLIIFGFLIDLWHTLLINRYYLIVISLLSILLLFRSKRYKNLASIFLLILSISFFSSFMFQYQGSKWLIDYFPILKSLNFVRFYFIEPFLLAILVVYSISIYVKKLHYTPIFILIFLVTQFTFSIELNFYKTEDVFDYLSFNKYYAPKTFEKLKNDIEETYPDRNITDFRFISYGLEPAVPLFNGLYTVDGYSTNYPLSYKKEFRKILNSNFKHIYDEWGSKLYVMDIYSGVKEYKRFIVSKSEMSSVHFNANIEAMCELGTDFIISSHPLKKIEEKPLKLFKKYLDEFWRIWVYKIDCSVYETKNRK
jgi:hypothetical protein